MAHNNLLALFDAIDKLDLEKVLENVLMIDDLNAQLAFKARYTPNNTDGITAVECITYKLARLNRLSLSIDRMSEQVQDAYIQGTKSAFLILDCLLSHGANPEGGDPEYTPLHIAAQFSSPNVLHILLKYKANLNAQDEGGLTPLHYACSAYGSTCFIPTDNAKTLLAAGANINAQDFEGMTPARSITTFTSDLIGNPQKLEILKSLVTLGADLNIKDINGISPLIVAQQPSRHDIREALEEVNVSVKPISPKQYKPTLIYEDDWYTARSIDSEVYRLMDPKTLPNIAKPHVVYRNNNYEMPYLASKDMIRLGIKFQLHFDAVNKVKRLPPSRFSNDDTSTHFPKSLIIASIGTGVLFLLNAPILFGIAASSPLLNIAICAGISSLLTFTIKHTYRSLLNNIKNIPKKYAELPKYISLYNTNPELEQIKSLTPLFKAQPLKSLTDSKPGFIIQDDSLNQKEKTSFKI